MGNTPLTSIQLGPQPYILKKPYIWILHVLFWVLSIFTKFFIFNTLYTFEVSLWRAFINDFLVIILFYVNFIFVDRFLEKRQILWYILTTGSVFALVSYVRFFFNYGLPYVNLTPELFKDTYRLLVAVFGSSFIYLMLSTFYQLIYNRFKNEQKALKIINEQNQAQLQFLKAQINPHFLFNTLNNIYALAVIRSEKTADMVLKLSDLLRYVIYDGQQNKVLLRREVIFIKKYIELFQMRNETPRNITFEVKGNTDEFRMEPMIMIPLVENCLKHCDFETNEEAFVNINLEVKEGKLYFSTRNSKNDQDVQKDSTGGVGLENIKKRLSLKYPQAHRLSIAENEKRTIFEVKLDIMLSV